MRLAGDNQAQGVGAFLLVAAILTNGAVALDAPNMNGGGEYLIANQPETGKQYNTSFGAKNAEYFEVYAGPLLLIILYYESA